MWNHRPAVGPESPELKVVPIESARSAQKPADTKTRIEKEAFKWLVGQLKWERTLEVLRTYGPAPEHQQRAAA